MHALLHAVATAVPGLPRSQQELAGVMREFHSLEGNGARRLRALYRKSAIESRHSCLARDWNGDGSESFFPSRPNGSGSVPTTVLVP